MKNIKYSLVVFTCFLSFMGCESILEPEPQGQISLDALFTNQENAITAINGVYNLLPALYNDPMSRLTDLASDDGWTWRNELETDIYIVEQSFNHSRTVWASHYKGINRANVVLAGIEEVPEWENPDMPNLIEGQAKFMRAFYYFNLVRFFGPVPLIVNAVEAPEDASLPRTDLPMIYNQIKTDLTEAASLLPESYDGGKGQEVGRPTKQTAQLLLSYVHLELEEWEAAASMASGLIGKGSLVDYQNNFNGSDENGMSSFFEVQYASPGSGVSAGQNSWFAPSAFKGGATVLPTDDSLNGTGGGPSSGNGFVQAYEEGDLRKDVTIATYGIPNFIDPTKPDGSLYYVNKYYNESVVIGESPWNVPLLRYADVLMIAAEALNEIGYTANGPAFDYLNQIRTKAGLVALDNSDLPNQEAFRIAVRKERRIEFAFEYKRFFDLNRWGVLESVITPQLSFLDLSFPSSKTTAHPITGKSYYLYPVPDVEFLNNPNIGNQNPGYD